MSTKYKNSSITVSVHPFADKPGKYAAVYQSEIMEAAFFVVFRDNVMGSRALNTFIEMLQHKYQTKIDIHIEHSRQIKFDQSIKDVLRKQDLSQPNILK